MGSSHDDWKGSIVDEVSQNKTKEFIDNIDKDAIIDSIVDRVSSEIIRKKKIVAEMPKKSEIISIDKEWEDYFVTLIDKAIAKRFK